MGIGLFFVVLTFMAFFVPLYEQNKNVSKTVATLFAASMKQLAFIGIAFITFNGMVNETLLIVCATLLSYSVIYGQLFPDDRFDWHEFRTVHWA